jgi:hypothetical protein
MPSPRVVAPAVALLLLMVPLAPHADSARDADRPRQAAQAKPAEASKPQAPPSAKLAEPFPDAAKLAERRIDAEGRRLFQQSEPLAFTLAADFKAVNRDRDTESTKTFPAQLTVRDEAGGNATAPLQVTLRTRGILRLNPRTCSFVPLSIEFPKKAVKSTVFDGQGKLKLVTHCQNDQLYEQYVLREYLAYRLYNLVTPRSFRVRLARATYVDSTNGRTLSTHNAIFIEDEDDLARRMEGRALALPSMLFRDFDRHSLTLMMLFQYMIGNTDFSIYLLHNVHMVQTPAKLLYPIIWDFDISGLVHPVYASPDPRLKIASLRERLYRGPCRTMNEYEQALAIFRARQAEALALVDSVPGLTQDSRRNAARFLGQFYTLLGRKDQLKRELVDRCINKARM